jgi:carbon-monoxide dehydrogenase medium subunit
MKPPAFEYIPVSSVDAALAALDAAGGDAKIVAGGQSLVPMLNFRLLKPSALIDINRIAELAFIEDAGDTIRVGALTRHRHLEMSPLVRDHLPVISEAMAHVAHLAIRNRGTIGGSLSHADPAAELPMLACLLDARFKIRSRSGERMVSAHDFFKGQLTVDLGECELLTEIRFPKLPPATGWGFAEVARRGGDFALTAVAATLTLAGGKIRQARIAITGVAETPCRAAAAEALLIGHAIRPELLEAAGVAARAAIETKTDIHASADYRRHLVGVLTKQTLTEAWRRAMDAAA